MCFRALQCVAEAHDVLQKITMCCSATLRCVAVRRLALNFLLEYENLLSHLLQCIVVCCSILQCIALSCIELQCGEVCCNLGIMLWSVVMCCSKAGCVAVRQGALK